VATEGFRSQLERVTVHAKETLADLGYPWALVGGLAVSARAEPRFTRDVDFAVALKSDREAETLILAMQARGYRIDTVLEQETTGLLATVRLVAPGSGEHGVILDLLFASSGIETEVVERATVIEVFPGIELPVARVPELLALKILARDDERRPQDTIDIRTLLQEATASDLEATKKALALIAERGFHRNRDLLQDFEDLTKRFRS
jgi:predicted nucleotidyltransferase